MESRKHRTPSGLPPSNFEEGADAWDLVQKPQNELDLILKHGVWAPRSARIAKLRSTTPPISHRIDGSLFSANSPQLSALQIIGWWEKRRAAYNALLLGSAAFALVLLWLTTFAFRFKMNGLSDAISRGDTLLDAQALIWLLIVSNAVFTLGWMVDLVSTYLPRWTRHCRQSASLLHAALGISLGCLGILSASLLHWAIAH